VPGSALQEHKDQPLFKKSVKKIIYIDRVEAGLVIIEQADRSLVFASCHKKPFRYLAV
jgi:hypothetical protein